MLHRSLVFILLALCLAACAIGPDYKTPEVPLPDQLGESEDQTFSKEQLRLFWWQAFEDEQLNQLVERAIVANKDVSQALSRVAEARALRRASFSELFPGTELNASYEEGEDSSARFPRGDGTSTSGFEFEVYEGSVDALWELDIFGRLRRDLESKRAEVDAAIADLHDVLRIVIADTVTSYFALRGAQKQLSIAKKNLKLQAESLAVARSKFELGATSELDMTRAQALLETTRASVPPLEARVRAERHRLAVLLGKLPRGLYDELTEVKGIPSYKGPITIGSTEALLRRRPDIRVAERTLASQTALVGVRIGELFPQVEIFGSLGVEAPEFSGLDEGMGVYRWGPRIRWAPFDSGRLISQIRAQEARVQQALAAYELSVLKALEDVENALVNYASEKERYVRLARALEASTQSFEISKAQYREGALDFLGVLDAQREVLQTESDLVTSEQALATRLVGIYRALGGGWQSQVPREDWSQLIAKPN